MEDLNKNQLILLTLLVSFVTSIATGIMTVSLLQEAPVEVTRNINRIVEKTIETVTPAVTTTQTKTKEITTIIVKEEDSIVDSINKNLKSIVRIREKNNILTEIFYGIGVVISKDGLIMADRKTIFRDSIYTAEMSDGTELVLSPIGVDKNTNIIIFRAVQPEKAEKPYVFSPSMLSDTEPKLGQTLVSIGGNETNSIAVGRVSFFNIKESTVGTTTTKYVSGIDMDIIAKDIVSGSPLINLSGDIVGLSLLGGSSKSFIPISMIKKEIAILNELTKENTKSQ